MENKIIIDKLNWIKGEKMKANLTRRDFIKYGVVSGGVLLMPNVVYGFDWGDVKRDVKVAFYASKLNPVRFFAGLVFDEVADILLKPLVKYAYNRFINGHSYSRSSLDYYSTIPQNEVIKYEPYKASTIIYGVVDYEKYKKKQNTKLLLALKRDKDNTRFKNISLYLKDEKAKLKLYNSHLAFRVQDSLDLTSLFELDYIVFNKHKERHYQNLLEITNNQSFGKLIV